MVAFEFISSVQKNRRNIFFKNSHGLSALIVMLNYTPRIQFNDDTETLFYVDKHIELTLGHFVFMLIEMPIEELQAAQKRIITALSSSRIPHTIIGYYVLLLMQRNEINNTIDCFSESSKWLFSEISKWMLSKQYDPSLDKIIDLIIGAKDKEMRAHYKKIDNSELYRNAWAFNTWSVFYHDGSLDTLKNKWYRRAYEGSFVHANALARDIADVIAIKDILPAFFSGKNEPVDIGENNKEWMYRNSANVTQDGGFSSFEELIAFELQEICRRKMSIHRCEVCGKLFIDHEPFANHCIEHRLESDLKEWRNKKKNYNRRNQEKTKFDQLNDRYLRWISAQKIELANEKYRKNRIEFSNEIHEHYNTWYEENNTRLQQITALLSDNKYNKNQEKITRLLSQIVLPAVVDRAPSYYEYRRAKDPSQQ